MADPPPPKWVTSFLDSPFAKIGLHIAIFSYIIEKNEHFKTGFFQARFS